MPLLSFNVISKIDINYCSLFTPKHIVSTVLQRDTNKAILPIFITPQTMANDVLAIRLFAIANEDSE